MKKKHPEHVNLERWLVSYADFITLMFAFFVIMYAISQADMAKFRKFTVGVKQAFAAGPVGMIDVGGGTGGTSISPMEEPESKGGRVQNLPAGRVHTASDPDPELQEIKELLEEAVSLELGVADISEKLYLQYDSNGLMIRIAAKDYFEDGSSEVKPDLRPILDRIGKILSKTRRLVRLEGHIDPSEEKSPSQGWALSTARAAWVAQYWVTRFDLDPTRVGVAGYSRFRPVAQSAEAHPATPSGSHRESPMGSNGTEESDEPKDTYSRAKNRRVEIIILNNQYDKP